MRKFHSFTFHFSGIEKISVLDPRSLSQSSWDTRKTTQLNENTENDSIRVMSLTSSLVFRQSFDEHSRTLPLTLVAAQPNRTFSNVCRRWSGLPTVESVSSETENEPFSSSETENETSRDERRKCPWMSTSTLTSTSKKSFPVRQISTATEPWSASSFSVADRRVSLCLGSHISFPR